jgi:hypothetical protein
VQGVWLRDLAFLQDGLAACSGSAGHMRAGVALPLAATLQQLCLRASRRSRAGLALLACILYFLALTSVGSPPGQPHPFWAPVSPHLSEDASGQCTLDWGAPMVRLHSSCPFCAAPSHACVTPAMPCQPTTCPQQHNKAKGKTPAAAQAWGWPFLLRLAAARRRRLQQSRQATITGPLPAIGTPPSTCQGQQESSCVCCQCHVAGTCHISRHASLQEVTCWSQPPKHYRVVTRLSDAQASCICVQAGSMGTGARH